MVGDSCIVARAFDSAWPVDADAVVDSQIDAAHNAVINALDIRQKDPSHATRAVCGTIDRGSGRISGLPPMEPHLRDNTGYVGHDVHGNRDGSDRSSIPLATTASVPWVGDGRRAYLAHYLGALRGRCAVRAKWEKTRIY
jgi:hypothetical protein